MKNDLITTRVADASSRHAVHLRAVALGLAAWLVSGCGERVDGLPRISLVGERAGVLVWHAVPEATNYRLDITDSAGKVRVAHAAPDTFAILPLDYAVVSGDRWWVRAYNGKKIIAASERARMY